MYPDILFSNRSSLDDSDVQRAVAAYQRQVGFDFAEHWGVSAVLHFVGDRALVDGEWGITFDDRTAADYLGEHHLEDVPRGVVLVGACKAFGDNPFETGSHELLELLGDPFANICVELTDGTLEAYEACDAVQGSGYDIDGVRVANFVSPLGYFNGRGSCFDFRGALSGAHQRTPGGYRLIRPPGLEWTQDVARELRATRAPGMWSRRGRRIARGSR